MMDILNYYRKKIDKANKKMIDLLYQRSKFRLNDSLDHEDPSLRGFYSKFLRGICLRGNNKNSSKVKALDDKISKLLWERISYGKPIAEHKELYSLNIENKEREKQVLAKIETYARNINFKKRKPLGKSFKYIIKTTKDYQHCIMEQRKRIRTNTKQGVQRMTDVKDCIPILEEDLKSCGYITRIQEIETPTGRKRYVVEGFKP